MDKRMNAIWVMNSIANLITFKIISYSIQLLAGNNVIDTSSKQVQQTHNIHNYAQ